MFYCIKCMQTHELAKSQKLFATGFYHFKNTRMKAGYCEFAAQDKPKSSMKCSSVSLHDAGMRSLNNRREHLAQMV